MAASTDRKRNRSNGAARTMSRHISKQGLKGNRRPSTKSVTSERSSSQAVGGYAGASFDNTSAG